MDQYQQDIMAGGLLDLGFIPHQIPMGGMSYEMQDGSSMLSQSIKDESFEPSYVGSFDGMQHQADSRSSSCTSATSQSLSPPLQHPHPDLYALQVNNLPYSTHSQQISPSTTDLSKKESDDESLRTERRRAQNRAAQRAYRQRKDHSLKQREHEIESLREELDKAQRLNKSLCQTVSVLRERLKEATDEPFRDDS